jgi:hypothetical protein
MKIYLYSLALFLIVSYLADTRITFSPFSISFGRGWLVLGVILIMCGCICLKAHWYDEGLKKGVEINRKLIKEVLEEDKIKEEL